MDIWVFIESGSDGFYSTTHLTEKGCLLSAVDVILDVLKVETDSQEAFDKWKEDECRWRIDDALDGLPPVVGWQNKTLEELWNIYDGYSELTWDISEFDCAIKRTTVQA